MDFRTVALGFVAVSGLCSCIKKNADKAEVSSFQPDVVRAQGLALQPGDVALTFDDGPSQFSLGLAKYLENKQIPAAYFVNYHNRDQRASTPGFHMDQDSGQKTVKEICGMSTQLLASHGDEHDFNKRDPQAIAKTTTALMNLCPKPFYFIRFPGGKYQSSSERAPLNETQIPGQKMRYGELYVGPVNWDVTGEDWSQGCQADVNNCRDTYANLTLGADKNVSCKGGILLFHDIYPSTMEIVLGKNWKTHLTNPSAPLDGDGLIARLQQKGCRFVSLDKNEVVLEELLGQQLLPQKGAAESLSHLSTIHARADFSMNLSDTEKCTIPKGTKFAFERQQRTHVNAQFQVTITELPKEAKCSDAFQAGKTAYFYGNFFEIQNQYAKGR